MFLKTKPSEETNEQTKEKQKLLREIWKIVVNKSPSFLLHSVFVLNWWIWLSAQIVELPADSIPQ